MQYTKHLISACLLVGAVGIGGCKTKTITTTTTTTNTFAYISSEYALEVCNVNTVTGQITGCQRVDPTSIYGANNTSAEYLTIAIQSIGAQTYAYVANYSNGEISQCSINPLDGTFTTCNPSGATGMSTPYGIAFNTAANGNLYAYFINDASGYPVQKCLVNLITGQLSECTDLGTGTGNDYGNLIFNTINGNTYVYSPTGGSSIKICAVDSEGNFSSSSCSTQTISAIAESYGIAFAPAGNQINAYIADYDDGNITQCMVNSTDGTLVNCSPQIYVYEPAGMGVQFLNNQWYIYAGNYESYGAGVLQCTVNSSTANLQNCMNNSVGPLYYTTNIVFATLTVTQ